MKPSLTALFCICLFIATAQSAPAPIEEHNPISHWWWIVGVLIAIAAGIGLYMIIKKDPRKDAV